MKNDVILNNSSVASYYGLFNEVLDKIRQFSYEDGVANYFDRKNCIGHSISIIDNCNIRIYYMDRSATLEEAENCLAGVFGGKYYEDHSLVGYSEYTVTGYCINSCTIGGHDLVKEISSHVGEYLIFVMEW